MADETTGPIDDEALDTIIQLASTHRLVDRTYIDTNDGGRRELRIDLDLNGYPASVVGASLRVTWHTNDDYRFHYREEWDADERWQCRWDRHPHTHDAARKHFHEPPNAAEEPTSDSVTTIEPYHLFTRTMANVSERIERMWMESS